MRPLLVSTLVEEFVCSGTIPITADVAKFGKKSDYQSLSVNWSVNGVVTNSSVHIRNTRYSEWCRQLMIQTVNLGSFSLCGRQQLPVIKGVDQSAQWDGGHGECQ